MVRVPIMVLATGDQLRVTHNQIMQMEIGLQRHSRQHVLLKPAFLASNHANTLNCGPAHLGLLRVSLCQFAHKFMTCLSAHV